MTPSNTEESLVERFAATVFREVEDQMDAEAVVKKAVAIIESRSEAMIEAAIKNIEAQCGGEIDPRKFRPRDLDTGSISRAMIQAALSEGEG